jgi:hypothetical protein
MDRINDESINDGSDQRWIGSTMDRINDESINDGIDQRMIDIDDRMLR